MQIPKTASVPSDSRKLSFLTLPSEIRNIINELLFERTDPILLHNSHFYYHRKPRAPEPESDDPDDENEVDDLTKFSLECGGQGIGDLHGPSFPRINYQSQYEQYCENLEKWEKRIENERDVAKVFEHHVADGFGLLKSCRQLYHETVGILYRHNTFTVSRVLSRHDMDELIVPNDRCEYHQQNYALVWLRSLGSQYQFLQTVLIDASATCIRTCWRSDYSTNLLPLLRIIWENASARCNITFAHTGRKLDNRVHETSDASDDAIEAYASKLNKITMSIGKDDVLDLRRFSHSDVLLNSVGIDADGNEGTVSYYSEDQEPSICRKFSVPEGDSPIYWKPNESAKSLLDLDRGVQDIIYRYVTSSLDDITLDLNTHTAHGLELSVFQVNRNLRLHYTQGAIEAIGRNVPLTLELTTAEKTTNFDKFSRLRGVYPIRYISHSGGRYQDFVSHIIGSSIKSRVGITKATILLSFVLAEKAPLSELRINVNELLRLLWDSRLVPMHDKVTLTIKLSYGEDKEACSETADTTIAQLKMSVFLYFTDLLHQLPEDAFPVMPEVWVDGNGDLVDKDLAHRSFPFTAADSLEVTADDEKFKDAARTIISRFGTKGSRHQCWYHHERECAYCVWDVSRVWATKYWKSERFWRKYKQSEDE